MRRPAAAAIAAALVLGTAGCTAADVDCAVGYEPTFLLSVRSTSTVEPAVRFCDADQCSPVPPDGAIPALLLDRSQEAPARVDHLGRGEWRISPRGRAASDGAPPTTARIELYEDGRKVAVRTIRLSWPSVDPCAASNPPIPRATVAAG